MKSVDELLKEVIAIKLRKDVIEKRIKEIFKEAEEDETSFYKHTEELSRLEKELVGMLRRMMEIHSERQDIDNFNLIG